MPILNFVVHKFHKKSVKFQIICEFHLFFWYIANFLNLCCKMMLCVAVKFSDKKMAIPPKRRQSGSYELKGTLHPYDEKVKLFLFL